MSPARWLAAVRGVVLDLDGVIYRGETPLPGAREFCAYLQAQGLPFVFATNNSTRTPQQYAERLQRMGILVEPDRIVTSALVAAEFLRTHAGPNTPVYVIGGEGIRQALLEAGCVLSEDPEAVRFVVVGLDVELTYGKLRAACRALRKGAGFLAANCDPVLPVDEDLWPGAGAIVAALRYATGRDPVVVGKPERPLLLAALRRLGRKPQEAVMVGDQLGTDVAGAVRVGMRSVLVRSGVSESPGAEDIHPDLIVRDLLELLTLWQEAATRARR